jgi:hypothetical protein
VIFILSSSSQETANWRIVSNRLIIRRLSCLPRTNNNNKVKITNIRNCKTHISHLNNIQQFIKIIQNSPNLCEVLMEEMM